MIELSDGKNVFRVNKHQLVGELKKDVIETQMLLNPTVKQVSG